MRSKLTDRQVGETDSMRDKFSFTRIRAHRPLGWSVPMAVVLLVAIATEWVTLVADTKNPLGQKWAALIGIDDYTEILSAVPNRNSWTPALSTSIPRKAVEND
jgi:hypothetical protein